jgi:hypothetical protein
MIGRRHFHPSFFRFAVGLALNGFATRFVAQAPNTTSNSL